MGAETKQKKKIGLTTKIFIALLAGAVFGIVLCYMIPSGHVKDDIIVEGILYVVGQGFIRLMKMLVVPLVFCSLVCGSMAIGDTKKLGTVGVRTPVSYTHLTAVQVLNGEEYEKEVYEDVFMINRDNVDMYGTDGWQ